MAKNFLIEKKRMKENIVNTEEEETIETIKETKTKREKVINLIILPKKLLIVVLMKMIKKLSMFI